MKRKLLLIFQLVLIILVSGCSSARVSRLEDRQDKLEDRVDTNEDWLFFIENEVLAEDFENE